MVNTKKALNNIPFNAAAWTYEGETNKKTHQDGIIIGLYKKPEKKELAGPALEVVRVMSDNGKLVCRINMKRLKEFGGELEIEDNEGCNIFPRPV